ncbi:MAG: hypothetical protein INH41_10355 [Myxococcaceae bacterium]|jgi:hypothetical protein|nr:hypothetical protein [Myxococcaceae bacterium]
MRLLAFCLSFVIGLLVACAPSKRCTAATCQGCCTADDTCETGTSATACGAGAMRCDVCVGAQQCVSGRCEGASGVGGGAAGGASGGGQAMGGGVSGSELSGTYQAVWGWDGDGGRSAFLDAFDRAPVGVWYRDGGAFDFVRGRGNADGTFVVREVPAGEVTLQLARRYFVTTSRRLNFDSFVGGRLDATRATAESLMRFTLRGLEPIGPTNATGFFFTQQTGQVSNLENVATPATPAGSTSLESDLDWARVTEALDYGLPDGTRGDRGWALQLGRTDFDGGSLSALRRVAPFPPLTLANGGSVDAIADLTAPATQPLTLSADTSAFQALRASFGRDVGTASFSAEVTTSPAPAPHRVAGQGAFTLASFFVSETSALPPLPLPTSAFPTTWGRTVTLSYGRAQQRALTDGGTPAGFFGGVTVADDVAAFTGPVTPRLGPVRGAQLGGRSFLDDLSGVTTTPTISWMAPALGTVSTYRLSVNRLAAGGTVAELWRLYTNNPAVTLPPGILVAGEAYVLELEALAFGQGGLTFTLPFLSSTVVSGVIRP